MIDRNKPVAIEGKDWPVTIVDWDFDARAALKGERGDD